MIGVADLSEVALELEKASKDGDAATVERLHDKAIQRYKEVVDAVNKAMGTDDGNMSDDDDVLEFVPG